VVLSYWESCGLPRPEIEFRFHDARRFLFDFAWPGFKVALEVQGGLFGRVLGAHARGAAIRKDHEKRNLAASEGWVILYVLPEEVAMQSTADLIRKTLDAGGPS